jgi:hypothetical protein
LVSIQSAGANSGNPGTVSSATGGNTTGGTLRIGKGQGFLDGDIAELLFYNRTLTTEERNLVAFYFNDKYDLSIPEPSTMALMAVAAFTLLRRRLHRA